MRSEQALQRCCLGLVALNLVFVYLTGAADPLWLLGLLALTAAAPWLVRFRDRFLYRQAWNLGAIAFMGLLAQHALNAELASVLQDGLTLAVLCQVHLLNNLRSDQQPDLLFFNTFLIAIVTGYLTRDLAFAAAFLIFAPLYVVGLQLLTANRRGYDLEADVTRRLIHDGCRRSAVLLLLSLLVFLFWPRDFEREAFFAGKFDTLDNSNRAEVGFAEQLELHGLGDVATGALPALRATLRRGRAADVPGLLRGATLAEVRGSDWYPLQPGALSGSASPKTAWNIEGRVAVRGTEAAVSTPILLELERLDGRTERLFTTPDATRVELNAQHRAGVLRGSYDGSLKYSKLGRLTYTLGLGGPPVAAPPGASEPDLAPYLQVPDEAALEPAARLADNLVRRLPRDHGQDELVDLFVKHLANTYDYALPGADGAARTLTQFLSAHQPGHCEFFASGLGLMLRSQGVPARLVTGYRGGNWDDSTRTLTLSSNDAHVWVEVLDPDRGWVEVDPTPALSTATAGLGRLAQAKLGLQRGWEQLTGFDAERRAAFLAGVLRLPGRAVRALLRRSGAAFGLLGIAALIAGLRLRQRRQPQALRQYQRALRKCRLRPVGGETPRELLERARGGELGPQRVEALERATLEHEAERYAA